jgi:Na+/glutamate symporter
MDERRRLQERIIFALRLALVLLALAVGYWLLSWLRRRNSRYLPLAGAVLAFATILAFVLAGDYVTDYFHPFDEGILVLSVIGVLATIAAFFVLQRYLARRLTRRRVRRGECPFCGFATGRGEHCEGCGRSVVAPCARCSAPRRVGAPFCATCGNP